MPATKRVAVSDALSGMLVFSCENGGDPGPTSLGPSSSRTQICVRAQDDSENGALDHGQSQLEITLRHALRFHRLFHFKASILFKFQSRLLRPGLLSILGSHSQHNTWYYLKDPITQTRYPDPPVIFLFTRSCLLLFIELHRLFGFVYSDRFRGFCAVDDSSCCCAMRRRGSFWLSREWKRSNGVVLRESK